MIHSDAFGIQAIEATCQCEMMCFPLFPNFSGGCSDSRPGTIPVPEGAKDIAALTRPNAHLQGILLCSFTEQMVLLESMGKSDHFKSTLLKKTSEFRLGFPDGDNIIMVHNLEYVRPFIDKILAWRPSCLVVNARMDCQT
jgi:hypothetical protein